VKVWRPGTLVWRGKSTISKQTLYFCGLCTYKSPHLTNAKGHARSHTGEKPFVCHLCRLGFAAHMSLKNHLVRVHAMALQ
jgi:uncharacterized Zn-finger protein